jgi:hypothetical protein
VTRAFLRSVRGSPKEANTLESIKPVIAQTRSPRNVRTMSPKACAIGA